MSCPSWQVVLAGPGLELGGPALAGTVLTTMLPWPKAQVCPRVLKPRVADKLPLNHNHYPEDFGQSHSGGGAVGHPETMWGAEG